jgi:hypothetical protein
MLLDIGRIALDHYRGGYDTTRLAILVTSDERREREQIFRA